MSDEALMALIRRAQDDAAFRDSMLRDPAVTLRDGDYNLTADEHAAILEFHTRVAGLTPEERDAQIAAAATGEGF